MSADLAELWTKLIEAVGRVSPFTRSYLVDANPVSFDKGILTIGFDPEFEDHLGLVDNAAQSHAAANQAGRAGPCQRQIKFVKAEAPAVRRAATGQGCAACPDRAAKPGRSAAPRRPAKEKSAPVAFNKNDFKNDPLIQKALEIFKGQIVEVRA